MTDSPNAFLDVSAELLRRGYHVRFQARGQSMVPTIKDGERISVKPVCASDIRPGDILLCHNRGRVMAHRVVGRKQVSEGDVFIVRGDASLDGHEPVTAEQVLGKVISVERDGRHLTLKRRSAKMVYIVRQTRRIIRGFTGAGGATCVY